MTKKKAPSKKKVAKKKTPSKKKAAKKISKKTAPKKTKKAKGGRPALPASKVLSTKGQVRMTKAELGRCTKAAQADGYVGFSDWARETLTELADRVLADSKPAPAKKKAAPKKKAAAKAA